MDPSQVVSAYAQVIGAAQRSFSETPAAAAAISKSPLEQKILHGVLEMKLIGTDAMSMIVRPDGQTEVHLFLAMTHGQVSVEAKVSTVDLANLQGQWSDLQQSLAQQGVHLKPLAEMASQTEGGQGGANTDGSPKFSQQDSDESNGRAPVFKEESTLPQFQFFPKPAGIRRFWESWA